MGFDLGHVQVGVSCNVTQQCRKKRCKICLASLSHRCSGTHQALRSQAHLIFLGKNHRIKLFRSNSFKTFYLISMQGALASAQMQILGSSASRSTMLVIQEMWGCVISYHLLASCFKSLGKFGPIGGTGAGWSFS